MRPSPAAIAWTLLRLGLLLALLPTRAASQVPEAELKAAFIYNFARFTQWPDSAAAAGPSFCIDEHSPLTPAVRALAGKPLDGRPLTVRTITADMAPSGCRVWILGPASAPPPVDPQGTLVVSEGDRLDGRVMIVLVLEDSHVRFDIDTLAAQKAGLRFSSQLLRLARTTR